MAIVLPEIRVFDTLEGSLVQSVILPESSGVKPVSGCVQDDKCFVGLNNGGKIYSSTNDLDWTTDGQQFSQTSINCLINVTTAM